MTIGIDVYEEGRTAGITAEQARLKKRCIDLASAAKSAAVNAKRVGANGLAAEHDAAARAYQKVANECQTKTPKLGPNARKRAARAGT